MSVVVLCPLRIEAAAFRGTGVPVIRTGMGPGRARAAWNDLLRRHEGAAVVVAGFCGAVDGDLRAGDAVLATEVRSSAGVRACPAGAGLTPQLQGAGLRVRTGAIFSADRILGPTERARLDGVLAVDMESYWLVEGAGERDVAVVRVVVDQAGRRLLDPRTPAAGVRALRSLRRAAPVLAEFAASPLPESLRY